MQYIWNNEKWPNFTWNWEKITSALSECRKAQGCLKGKLTMIKLDEKGSARRQVLVEEAIQTSAIEGEKLDLDALRSSVARHLSLKYKGKYKKDNKVEGLVEMLLDAYDNFNEPITGERLFGWHAGLFPIGYSGIKKINVGNWRSEAIYVVSGPVGKEVIHFEAPPANRVKSEMKSFFKWWVDSKKNTDGLIRAGIAHLYFVMIHPFEDGNGRIARALTDMAIAQDENSGKRYYSISKEIIAKRKSYYDVLHSRGKGKLDITDWLLWFLETVNNAVNAGEKSLQAILAKIKFWQECDKIELNFRQRKVLNRMLEEEPEGFQGGLTTRKYVGTTKTSRATAFREIDDMLKKGVISKREGSGRSVSYSIVHII